MKRQYSLLLLSSLLLQSQLAVAGEHQGIQIGKTIMVASNDIQPAAESPFNKEQDMPMGQSSSDSKESLLPEDDRAKKTVNCSAPPAVDIFILSSRWAKNIQTTCTIWTRTRQATSLPGFLPEFGCPYPRSKRCP